MAAPTENALTDIRVEWVPESTIGTPPTDPAWNRFSDYFAEAPSWSGDAGTEGQNVVGSGWMSDHFRGSEEHQLTFEYWLQRSLVDGSGDLQDPLAAPLVNDFQTSYPSHTVVARREVTSGGADGAGFREYIVGTGCRPTGTTLPGDPAEAQPIAGQLTYECETVRQYVVHQPSASTTLTVSSTNTNDTMDVTVEDEGAGTTETVTLPGGGTNEATTSASFADIDAVYVDSEPEGDIQVDDGSGTDFLEDPITGSATDGVEGQQGIPLLGSGSHASAIGTDPANYLFLGTTSDYGGNNLSDSADRVHALDLTAEADVTRESRQGTRGQAIDIGTVTVTLEADVAGPYETAAQNARYFRQNEADITYGFTDMDIVVKNATVTDTDDVTRTAGDANIIYGVTYEGHGDPAVTVSQTP